MSLESRYEQLKADVEAWWVKYVGHPTVGSIAAQHLNTEGKPELDKIVASFTNPEVFHVEPVVVPTETPVESD